MVVKQQKFKHRRVRKCYYSYTIRYPFPPPESYRNSTSVSAQFLEVTKTPGWSIALKANMQAEKRCFWKF